MHRYATSLPDGFLEAAVKQLLQHPPGASKATTPRQTPAHDTPLSDTQPHGGKADRKENAAPNVEDAASIAACQLWSARASDAILLGDVALARELATETIEKGTLQQYRLAGLVYVLMTHNEVERGFAITCAAHAMGHPLVAGVQINLVRMLLSLPRFDLVQRLYKELPRVGEEHNTRSVLEIAVALARVDLQEGIRIYHELLANFGAPSPTSAGSSVWHHALAELFRIVGETAQHHAITAPSSSNGSMKQSLADVHKHGLSLLTSYADSGHALDFPSYSAAGTMLHSLGHSVYKDVEMTDIGQCPRCKSFLPLASDMTDDERKLLVEFTNKYMQDIEDRSAGAVRDLKKFARQFDQIDVVIDGLNLGYWRVKSFDWGQLLTAYRKCRSMGMDSAIVVKQHVRRAPSYARNSDAIAGMERAGKILYLPNNVPDDAFFLHLAVSNVNAMVLSNDEFKDHVSKLESRSARLVFRKWQAGHQIRIDADVKNPKVLHIYPPLPYIPFISRWEKGWHVPRQDGRWLCVQEPMASEIAELRNDGPAKDA